jgi:hypothetical protein
MAMAMDDRVTRRTMFRVAGRVVVIAVGIGFVAAPSLAASQSRPSRRSGLRVGASPSQELNLVANASFEEGAPGLDVPSWGIDDS